MFKLMWGHKKEKEVLNYMHDHLNLLCKATSTFMNLLETHDYSLITRVCCLEREGDTARRKALSLIFQGAFFPYMRSTFYKFIDLVEEAFDSVVNSVTILGIITPDPFIMDECVKISHYNEKICNLLTSAFNVAIKGKNIKRLEEISSSIRDIERKVDDIKIDMFSKMYCLEVSNFWEGKFLADLLNNLIRFSDIVEDASDILYLISISFH